jgi:hypothetical protein
VGNNPLTDLVKAALVADTHALMHSQWALPLAVITAVVGLSARGAAAVPGDFFRVNIRQIAYYGADFRVTADAMFSLAGCSTYNPNCRPVVHARFELRRNGRLVSSTSTRTIPGSSSLSAVLPALSTCRRPTRLTPRRRTVRRGYEVRLLATAYTGRAALDSQRKFITCRR